MTHGAMIAVSAAKAAAKSRARVIDAFRICGATAPERARPLAQLGLASDDRALVACIASGVIRGVDPRGRPAIIGYEHSRIEGYYLDEGAYMAERDRGGGGLRRSRVALVIVAILLVLLLLPLVFLAFQYA